MIVMPALIKRQDQIANDSSTHGSMFVPVITGSDGTVASAGTGHTVYHPVYMTAGNISNRFRRSHKNAVVPIAFLAIPQSLLDLSLFQF